VNRVMEWREVRRVLTGRCLDVARDYELEASRLPRRRCMPVA
jgi:hypothetical protein